MSQRCLFWNKIQACFDAKSLIHNMTLTNRDFAFTFAAMSSYLYIVKYELPIVIQAFMGANNG